MYRSILVVSLLLAIPGGTALATQITFSGVPTARLVTDAQNSTLATANSLVLAGSFANPAAFTLDMSASLGANYASILQNGGWEQFGLDTVSSSPNASVASSLQISGTGKIAGSVTDNNFGATKADFFNGKPIYLWVFNAPTVGAATQMGIFRATTATQPWTFPINAGGIGDVTSYSTTVTGAATIAAIGGYGTAGSSLRLTDSFNISAIPEPSTALFGLLTVLATLATRRGRA